MQKIGGAAATKKDRVFFFHIPKCAGMSVWHTIWDAVGGLDNCFQVGIKEQRLAFEAMSQQQAKSYRAVGGHGFLDVFTRKLAPMDDYLRVTVIRDPIDRVISEYNFIGGHSVHVRHGEVSGMSFEEFSRAGNHMSNMVTRFLTHAPNPEGALKVLERDFDAWFLTPDVNKLNALICNNFRTKLRRDRHENKSSSRIRRQDIDEATLRNLEILHWADVELYRELARREWGGTMKAAANA